MLTVNLKNIPNIWCWVTVAIAMFTHVTSAEQGDQHAAPNEVANSSSDVSTLYFIGYAHNPKTDALIYIEHHTMKQNLNGEYVSGKVEYLWPDNSLMAVKQLQFEQRASAPSVTFKEVDTEFKINIRSQPNTVDISYQEKPPADQWSIPVTKQQPIVIDAGFDRFIVQHWDVIMGGQPVAMEILAVSRGSFYDFEIRHLGSKNGLAEFEVKPTSLVLKWLVDPISVRYTIESRRLHQFTGLTNIRRVDDPDENFEAVIRYQYPKHPERNVEQTPSD